MRNAAIQLGANLVALALASAAAWAGPCEPTIEKSPIAGNDWYVERDGGRRCEGIYISPTGSTDVEIVSVTLGRLEYTLDHPPIFLVKLAVTGAFTRPVHLRAVHIPGSKYYQMDADMTGGTTLRWPLNDVVKPEGIISKDLGLYAYEVDSNGGIIFIPVSALVDGASAPSSQAVVTVLRVKNLATAKWRFVATSAKAGMYNMVTSEEDRVVITLSPSDHAPGALEFRWDEATTGQSHVKLFKFGG